MEEKLDNIEEEYKKMLETTSDCIECLSKLQKHQEKIVENLNKKEE